jgi:hypothetical protein
MANTGKARLRRGPPKKPWKPSSEILTFMDLGDGWMALLTTLPTEQGIYVLGFEIMLDPFWPMTTTADLPPRGITPALLRSVSLSKMKASVDLDYLQEHILGFAYHPPPSDPSRARRGPVGRGDDFYCEIAEEYLQACRESPTRPIEHLRKKRGDGEYATVRSWVAKARKRGFLAPAVKGERTGAPGPRLLELKSRAKGMAALRTTDRRP